MKTSIEIPDELVREIKILAAREGKKLKEIIAESLRDRLYGASAGKTFSLRDIDPVPVGSFLSKEEPDSMESMLDDRGHRY